MGPFVVEFYETRDGQRPAEDFLDELDIKMRSKLVMTLEGFTGTGKPSEGAIQQASG